GLLDFDRVVVDLSAQTLGTQCANQARCRAKGGFTHPDHVSRQGRSGLQNGGCLDGQNQTVLTYGESDSWRRRATEHLGESIVASTPHQRILRAQRPTVT